MWLLLAACGSPSEVKPDIDAAPDTVRPDAGPCGFRTGMRGKTNRMMKVATLDRTYIVYLPQAVDPKQPIPLVFVHHGYTMSGQAMFDVTGYSALADREQIALAFPDGQAGPNSLGAPWNVGTKVCPAGGSEPPSAMGDDFAFLDAMKADIWADQCIDESHIYVTGFSMGGYFSHHVGCMRDDIRAVAPHSGGTHALDTCTTQRKPIIIFHGTSDPVVPDGCDDPNVAPPPNVTASATAWAAKNGCAATATAMAVQGGSCAYYDGCPADGQVAICTFTGACHCWGGGPGFYGCGAGTADATALEWDFFKRYAW